MYFTDNSLLLNISAFRFNDFCFLHYTLLNSSILISFSNSSTNFSVFKTGLSSNLRELNSYRNLNKKFSLYFYIIYSLYLSSFYFIQIYFTMLLSKKEKEKETKLN